MMLILNFSQSVNCTMGHRKQERDRPSRPYLCQFCACKEFLRAQHQQETCCDIFWNSKRVSSDAGIIVLTLVVLLGPWSLMPFITFKTSTMFHNEDAIVNADK